MISKINNDGEHLSRLLDSGIKYINRGWKLVLMGYSDDKENPSYKIPLTNWKTEYISNETELEQQLLKFKNKVFGIAVITGELSGITVVDVDDLELLKYLELPETLEHTTGRGRHYFYKYNPDANNGPHPEYKKVDILNGKLAILPPSKHHSGTTYQEVENCDVDIDNLPNFPRHLIIENKTIDNEYKPSRDIWTKEITQSSRNDIAIKVARYLIATDDPDNANDSFIKWNNTMCVPPLPNIEIQSVYKSALKYYNRDGSDKITQRQNEADKLLELILSDSSIILFNSNNIGYMHITFGNVSRNYQIDSLIIENLLSKKYYDRYHKVIGRESIKSVQRILEAQAIHEGEQFVLYNRVGLRDSMFYFDTNSNTKEYAQISHGNLAILPNTNIIFSESMIAKPAIIGENSEPLGKLLDLYKLQNSSDKLLLEVLVISYFIPNVTYPIAYFFGDYGSGKSSICRLIRNIIDPSIADISEFPKSEDDFVNQLNQSYLSVFDNVSTINQEQSDRLCRAATGGTLQKRKLYTNSDIIITSYKRPVILNGINLGGHKPDLMDRCMLFKLDRIPEVARKTEAELGIYISELMPGVRRYCLEILAKAMQLKSESASKPPSLNRMADYSEWGWYITEAMGQDPEDFIKALKSNKENQVFESLSNNVIAQSIIDLIEQSPTKYFSGSPTTLLKELRGLTQNENSRLPHTPQGLMKIINELKTNLAEVGIVIESGKENESTRYVRVMKFGNKEPKEITEDTDKKQGYQAIDSTETPF